MKKSVLDNIYSYLNSFEDSSFVNKEVILLSKKIESFCFDCQKEFPSISLNKSMSSKINDIHFSHKQSCINECYDDEIESSCEEVNFNPSSYVDHDILNKYLHLTDYLKNSYDEKKSLVYLNNLISSKDLTNADIINKSFIDGGLLSRILNGKSNVTKDSAIKLCFGLELNYDESIDLLLRFGYTLSALNRRDCIIRYGIDNNLDIDEIDYILEELDEKSLIRK